MLDLIKVIRKSDPSHQISLYPYDFVTSGFSRVDETRFLIEDQSEWDFCYETKDLIANNAAAAKRFGLRAGFSPEKAMLSRMLIKLQAGPQIMTYAWGLYSDMIKSENNLH